MVDASSMKWIGRIVIALGCAASVGCAGEAQVEEELEGVTSRVMPVAGKCPDYAVCVYANADYNDYDPASAWSLEFSPSEVYDGNFKRDIEQNVVSSIINNSTKTICLIDLQPLDFDERIYRLGPGERTAFVGHIANDRGDRIEEC
jgi:hypothetical protein